MITIPLPRSLRLGAFILFALVLFTLTHWPKLRVEGSIPRPDLVAHLVAFGLWAFLLNLSGLMGEPGRAPTAVRAFLVGLVYAAFDELTQMIPGLGRFAGWDDYFANAVGLALGCVLAMGVRTYPEHRPLGG